MFSKEKRVSDYRFGQVVSESFDQSMNTHLYQHALCTHHVVLAVWSVGVLPLLSDNSVHCPLMYMHVC